MSILQNISMKYKALFSHFNNETDILNWYSVFNDELQLSIIMILREQWCEHCHIQNTVALKFNILDSANEHEHLMKSWIKNY